MGTVTIVLNDLPYGIAGEKINLFLVGDSVVAAKAGQETPKGYYNAAEMLADIVTKGGTVKVCGTCIKARGIRTEELVSGVQIGRMLELAGWIKESDKVLTF